MRKTLRLALVGLMLVIGTQSALAQRVTQGQPGVGRRGARLPYNPRKLDRPPFGNLQIGRRPGAFPPRNQEQKRQLRQQLMQAIGLTPEQHIRMQEIRRGHDDEVIAAGRRLRQARRSLDLAIMSERYDEATVRRATDELAAAQTEKIKLDSKIRAEVRGVLTPDQVTRFHQLERQMRQELRQQNLQDREKEMQQSNPSSPPPLGANENELIDLISSRTDNR
jgi:Spy/CpxP family protein refolding chaperone